MDTNPEPTAEELLHTILNHPPNRPPLNYSWRGHKHGYRNRLHFCLWLLSQGCGHVSKSRIGPSIYVSDEVKLFMQRFNEVVIQIGQTYRYERNR